MENFIQELISNPQLLTVLEMVLKLALFVIGILVYRRTGKIIKPSAKQETTVDNHPLSVEDLEEFAVSLALTVDKITELKDKAVKK